MLYTMKQRMSSDKAASNTVENVIIIALAMFAGFVLFRAVLKPTEDSANSLGKSIKTNVNNLLKGDDLDGNIKSPE